MNNTPAPIQPSRWWSPQAIILLLLLLYFGSPLLVPLCYGLFIAIVLYPLCKWLELHKAPRTLAVALCLLLVILLFLALAGLLLVEFNWFLKDLPRLLQALRPLVKDIQNTLAHWLQIPPEESEAWWQQLIAGARSQVPGAVGTSIAGTGTIAVSLFLIPVYAALFLYNRHRFVQALERIIPERYKEQLPGILLEVIHSYHTFIKGMVMVYLVVGVLNSLGLLLLGIPHAILFGMLTAVMTIIPYVGILVSALLPISVAWLTKGSVWYPVGVVAIFAIVQYLEANLIFPRIVAAQLKVSTWSTLVAIVAGGILWGVSGMILFIPFIGIAKLVLDRVGDDGPINSLLTR
ncbi:AI-2E family transporter [Paraflavitalea pollutisoli]|uniref:AI-2E family transporter n=1 Tax=Paraflavitalea pollutisoli TaxID=3034143 RepID=UPI0023EB5E72|nr:AI-2E family transporter [Paraflavitalea sp. H1-2-19X]